MSTIKRTTLLFAYHTEKLPTSKQSPIIKVQNPYPSTPTSEGVAQWLEHWPVNQKVTSSIPSQGTCLSYGPGPQYGACEKQPTDVSLPLFLPIYLKDK